jgi:hypothetical protein
MLLVTLHSVGKNIPFILGAKAIYGFYRRQAFKAILRAETEFMLSVFVKAAISVPYMPKMNISSGMVTGIVKIAA